MTRLQVRRRLYTLCHVHWPRILALYDEWKANRDVFVNVGEPTRRQAILDWERESELLRLSKVLRVSGKSNPKARLSALTGKDLSE